MVDPGSVRAIEEPESYQHLIAQVALTRRFAALVEKGSRIIITTRGDWLIGPATAILLRSGVPETMQRNFTALCLD